MPVLQGVDCDARCLREVIKRVREAVAEPIKLEGKELLVTCSVGVATSSDARDADQLLQA